MKYLLFSSAVIAALVILANEEGINPDKISDSLKSVSEKVRSEVAAIVDRPLEPNTKAAIKTAEVSVQVPEKGAPESYVSPLPNPASVPLRPVVAPDLMVVSDDVEPNGEKTRAGAPPPPAPPISGGTKQIKSAYTKPDYRNKTKKIRLAEGDRMMTSKQRRRELNALARDMETMFLDKVVK
jgi:hypothetical protein